MKNILLQLLNIEINVQVGIDGKFSFTPFLNFQTSPKNLALTLENFALRDNIRKMIRLSFKFPRLLSR